MLGELIINALTQSKTPSIKARHSLLKPGDPVRVNGKTGEVIRIYEDTALVDFGGGVKSEVDIEQL